MSGPAARPARPAPAAHRQPTRATALLRRVRRHSAGRHRAAVLPATPAQQLLQPVGEPAGQRTPGRLPLRLSPGPIGLLLAGVVLVSGSGAVGAFGLTTSAAGRSRHAAPVATPTPPVAQPAALEALSPYLPQVSCNPVAMPGAVALGDLLRATYPGTSYGIARACGSDGIASEHYEGRAVDWMVSERDPVKLAQARSLIDWLLRPDAAGRPYANARRLGIMYLIWDDHIWGAYRAGDGWRPYSTCARHPEPSSDTACHRDHVHISLSWAGAAGRTSFWSGRVAAADYGPCRPTDLNWAAPYTAPRAVPCPPHATVVAPAGASAVTAALYRYSGAQLGQGASGPAVAAVQRGLGLTADGSLGPMTATAVSGFRVSHGLRAGRVVDAATWRALLAGGGTGAGSSPSPRPAPAPAPAPPVPSGPLAPYATQLLGYGASGPAVSAVQRLLGVTPTGWFGPRTQAAVRAFQAANKIPTTGNVGPLTWAALARQAARSGTS